MTTLASIDYYSIPFYKLLRVAIHTLQTQLNKCPRNLIMADCGNRLSSKFTVICLTEIDQANVRAHRTQITFAVRPNHICTPVQRGCYVSPSIFL